LQGARFQGHRCGGAVRRTLVALETTTEAVGITAAGAGVVIFEMTAQHFDLEEFFLDLTTSTTNLSTEGASQ